MAKHHDSSPFLFPSSFPSYMSEDSEPTTRPSSSLSPQISSSQSTSSVNSPFKPGFSNNVAINDSGVRTHQAQRVRTYTKVNKRGCVGRSIDVTRYTGYDELRHELAWMFSIEGQLEDPQSCDWKLVYVDHENHMLLVGQDPWEEFVCSVQSIKILSPAEAQVD